MADNSTGLNAQYERGPFPGIYSGAEGAFRAPGSQGVTVTEQGPVIARPAVSPAGLPDGEGLGRVTVPVEAGDTTGFSDDVPAHESMITPGPVAEYLGTGAGQGHTGHWARHPWQQANGG